MKRGIIFLGKLFSQVIGDLIIVEFNLCFLGMFLKIRKVFVVVLGGVFMKEDLEYQLFLSVGQGFRLL